MQDALRAYLELAFGLTEASKKQARKVAMQLVGKGGAKAAQVQSMVDELVSTSRTNREGLARLVRYEVDRALGAVGLATSDEVSDLHTRVQTLERELREASVRSAWLTENADAPAPPEPATAGPAGTGGGPAAAKKAAPGTAVAQKSVAQKSVAKKTVKTAAAKKTAAKTAKKTTKAAAKKTAKKTAAKQVAAPRTAANRATG